MRILCLSLSLLLASLCSGLTQESNSLEGKEAAQGITLKNGEFLPNPEEEGNDAQYESDAQDSESLAESKSELTESLEAAERESKRTDELKGTKQGKSCKSCGQAYTEALEQLADLWSDYTDHLNNGGDPNYSGPNGTVKPAQGGGMHAQTTSGLRSSPDADGNNFTESEHSFCKRNGYK